MLAGTSNIWYARRVFAIVRPRGPNMSREVVAVAADHAGFELKSRLATELGEMGYEVLDLGTSGPESVDYPDYAEALAKAIGAGKAAKGVLVCGSGIGISIAANRYREVRAAPCHDTRSARLARQHNDANVLALGARLMDAEVATDCLKVFMATEFEGGRHQRRVDKMS